MDQLEIKCGDDLLQKLFKVVGEAAPCEYLSDLKSCSIRQIVIDALAELYLSGAPWPQCAYALCYVTGDYNRFDTQENLRQYLVDSSRNGPTGR